MNESAEHKLNKDIAELVYPNCDIKVRLGMDEVVVFDDDKQIYVDYLNNMNDLMPLIFEHEIELRKYEGRKYWTAYAKCIGAVIKSDNPQTALAECLLLALQAKAKENE